MIKDYVRESNVRPLELVLLTIKKDRRVAASLSQKRLEVESRMLNKLKLQRTSDKIILESIKLDPSKDKPSLRVLERKVSIEIEIERFFGSI